MFPQFVHSVLFIMFRYLSNHEANDSTQYGSNDSSNYAAKYNSMIVFFYVLKCVGISNPSLIQICIVFRYKTYFWSNNTAIHDTNNGKCYFDIKYALV